MLGELIHSSSSILSNTWTQGITIILNLKGTVSEISSYPLCKDGNERFRGSDSNYKRRSKLEIHQILENLGNFPNS